VGVNLLKNTYLCPAAIICCIHNKPGEFTESYKLDFNLKKTLSLASGPSTSHSQINVFAHKKQQAVTSLEDQLMAGTKHSGFRTHRIFTK